MNKEETQPTISHVRAVVINRNYLLVIKRNRYGHHFYTFPGGKVEPDESPEEAVVREVSEETSVTVAVERQLYLFQSSRWGSQLVYRCNYESGEPLLSVHSTEFADNQKGDNTYEPAWVDVETIGTLNLLPKVVTVQLLHDLNHGFSSQVVELDDA